MTQPMELLSITLILLYFSLHHSLIHNRGKLIELLNERRAMSVISVSSLDTSPVNVPRELANRVIVATSSDIGPMIVRGLLQ
jgi:hypothetical protein